MVMPYHLHMPSYFLETFTEYPLLYGLFAVAAYVIKNAVEEKAYENQEAYQRTQMQKDMIFERLREQGCRITRQRQLILDIILEEECSCCKEIYYKVQEKDRNI